MNYLFQYTIDNKKILVFFKFSVGILNYSLQPYCKSWIQVKIEKKNKNQAKTKYILKIYVHFQNS